MAKKPAPVPLNNTQVFNAIVLLLAFSFVAYILWSGAFIVSAHERSVILRFGAYNRTVGPGLKFKIPWVEERYNVDMSEHVLRLPYGERERTAQLIVDERNEEDALILTADLYAGVVEWNVMWRVSDPRQYLFAIQDIDIEPVIVALAQSTMNQAVGDYSADEALTVKRAEIGSVALKSMQESLDKFDCGIDVFEIQMQKVVPPIRVKPAFDEVNASIQHRDQLVNEARREQNQLIPLAEAARDQMVREAEGYSSRRRAEAEGEISAIRATYEQYKLAPEATRQRMYLETMERVLTNSGQKIILDSELKSFMPMLNLNQSSTLGNPQTPAR